MSVKSAILRSHAVLGLAVGPNNTVPSLVQDGILPSWTFAFPRAGAAVEPRQNTTARVTEYVSDLRQH